MECDVTIPFMDTIATSVVPPPISTIILPLAFPILTPAPINAAIGSSIKYAFREPALIAASTTARFSTSVINDGTQMIILGFSSRFPVTRRINSRIIYCAIRSSEITPLDSGRTTVI